MEGLARRYIIETTAALLLVMHVGLPLPSAQSRLRVVRRSPHPPVCSIAVVVGKIADRVCF